MVKIQIPTYSDNSDLDPNKDYSVEELASFVSHAKKGKTVRGAIAGAMLGKWGLSNQSITTKQLEISARYGTIVSGVPINIDSINRTMTIKGAWLLLAGTEAVDISKVIFPVVVVLGQNSGNWLSFNTDTQQFSFLTGPDKFTKSDLFLGWISVGGNAINYNLHTAEVTVDGSSKYAANTLRQAFFATGSPALLNTEMRELTIPAGAYKTIIAGNNVYQLPDDSAITIDLNPEPNRPGLAMYLAFDSTQMKINSYQSVTEVPLASYYLGYVSWEGTRPKVNLSLNVTINNDNQYVDRFDQNAYIASKMPFTIDMSNKTLSIPASGYANLYVSGGGYGLDKLESPINIDSGGNASFVYFDSMSKSIIATRNAYGEQPGRIFLGWISWDTPSPHFKFMFDCVIDNGVRTNLPLEKRFAGKVATTFGDSITQAINTNPTWTTLIANELELKTITNAGVSGSTYSKASNRTDSAVERVDAIKGQDIITVWFGINDYHYGCPLGTFGDGDVTTLFGSADYVYKTLITNNPTATIIVITPGKQHGYKTSPDSFTANKQGLLQLDYVNAIKQVADYYSLPVLDFYTNEGISPFVDAQKEMFFFDGLHPNQAGQYRVAKKITRFIENNG